MVFLSAGFPVPRHATSLALAAALLASSSNLALAAGCLGSVCDVSIGADPGTSSDGTTGAAGTLSYALAYANAQSGPTTINIQQGLNITLGGPLSPIFNSVTINGNGATISLTTPHSGAAARAVAAAALTLALAAAAVLA